MIRIGPRLKAYAWGQRDAIPHLLGLEGVSGPVAEAWFGAHETDPSELAEGGDLAALIAANPVETVGGDRLPYLLKVLAIASPLSIQVHPTSEQARAGFDAEQVAEINLTAPSRTFRDPRHKPEMIVALTPMRVLVGLRGVRELVDDLRRLGADSLVPLVEGRESLLTYVMAVLSGDVDDAVLERLADQPEGDTSIALAGRAARAFPGDPGALVALAMNAVVLEPGEACYVPPRAIHSYQSGVGVEIMANSDNVVRGGLTPKALDIERLEAILDAEPARPQVPAIRRSGAATVYSAPVDDFALMRIDRGSVVVPAAPRVVLALASARVSTADAVVELAPGEALFVALADGDVTVTTEGPVFVGLPGGGALDADR